MGGFLQPSPKQLLLAFELCQSVTQGAAVISFLDGSHDSSDLALDGFELQPIGLELLFVAIIATRRRGTLRPRESPAWYVQSSNPGHQLLLVGVERTSLAHIAPSANDPKRTRRRGPNCAKRVRCPGARPLPGRD